MTNQPWRKRGGKDDGKALPDLASRLVYSLLKSAAKVAARADLPMGEMLDLAQLAYFEEMRRHHPRELSTIAERLGLSARTVSTLNRRLKQAFFAAETEVQPVRRVASILLDGTKTLAELKRAAPELGDRSVKSALDFLKAKEWVQLENRRYTLSSRLRSYIDESVTRRIDGLNNQMEILASSVWRRFIEKEDTAIGRSWVFAARPEDIRPLLEETVRSLRHSAIDLEEVAIGTENFSRYGITIAFADVEDES